jgi:translocation and assembly module TamB
LNKGDWRGRLASGRIQAGGQDWQLQAPARLQRLASGQLDFGAHCWRSGQASLCGEDQRLAPEPRLRYHLSSSRWTAWPSGCRRTLPGKACSMPISTWTSRPAAPRALSLSMPVAAPCGTRQGPLDRLPYQALRLDSTLAPRRIDTRLAFRGERLGN